MQPTYPAFPSTIAVDTNDNMLTCADGMELRDYFAAKAIPALMTEYWNSDSMWDPTYQTIAEAAYTLADAMMEARFK